ncbi:glutamate--cysteine ligase, chloroplastic-like [Rosa rugosa]|uniref:glutamate--cysteine ligase, chloroplastic-like n=1 Tax=Rosa rugosa TaxID=74645 RepID=UPI002B401188|nr:glutamate--cysteine ligase, chloroplastic-like [Rosa rugosa]
MQYQQIAVLLNGIAERFKWEKIMEGHNIIGLKQVGLLYDEVSLQNVLDMIADWTPEERQMLRDKVPKMGLKTPFRDGLLKQVAEDVVKFAKDGLERRGFKESGFLNEAVEIMRTGNDMAFQIFSFPGIIWCSC